MSVGFAEKKMLSSLSRRGRRGHTFVALRRSSMSHMLVRAGMDQHQNSLLGHRLASIRPDVPFEKPQ